MPGRWSPYPEQPECRRLPLRRLPRAENRLPAVAYEWTVRNGTTLPISAVFDSKRRR